MFRIIRSRVVLAALFTLSVVATTHTGLAPTSFSPSTSTAHIAGSDPPWPPPVQLPVLL